MVSIERTAYPRFKSTPTAQNLHALYTLEGLLQNAAEIHTETVHADTQGQSAPVFHKSRKNCLYQAFRELERVVRTKKFPLIVTKLRTCVGRSNNRASRSRLLADGCSFQFFAYGSPCGRCSGSP